MAGFTHAVMIGIEEYQQKAIRPVRYAKNDVAEMTKLVVERLKVPQHQVAVWLNESATRSVLENDLPYFIESLSADDRFIFFYAGHGFHLNGTNRITAWDTHPSNYKGTTICIEDVLLAPLRKSKCRGSLVFVDACASNLSELDGFARDIRLSMTADEFREFVNSTDHYAAAFFSCSPSEGSYSFDALGHGIWTYHLLQAVRGKEADAIDREGIITSDSLKNYLSHVVPKFIREKTDIRLKQRPYAVIGANGIFQICSVVPSKSPVSAPSGPAPSYLSVEFRARERKPYRRMPGFKAGNSVPTRLSDSAESWAARLTKEEMTKELDLVHAKAKEILGLKRPTISLKFDRTNGGTIDSELFRFGIHATQNHDNPAELAIVRYLLPRAARHELPDEFDKIFPKPFDEVAIPFHILPAQYGNVADAVERLADDCGATFAETESTRLLRVTLPDGGLEVAIDVPREEIVITKAGSRGVLVMADLLEQTMVATLTSGILNAANVSGI